MPISVKVRVPGTTANCGPGFDTIGIACNIYNELELTVQEAGGLIIDVAGEGQEFISRDESNVVYQAIKTVFDKAGKTFGGIHIKMVNHIPLSRGLGSSAAAIVAGLVSANGVLDNQFTDNEILDMATEFEGHPDNVAPAIFGGVAVSAMQDSQAHCIRFVPPKRLQMVLAVPEFHLSTESARKVLPASVSLKDAVFNVSRTALLVGALCQGEFQHLKYALEDKIHQPYRQGLIPGMQDVFAAALEQGALGSVLSGAGPCLIAFTEDNAEAIGEAMVAAFKQHEVTSSYKILDIDNDGATIIAKNIL